MDKGDKVNEEEVEEVNEAEVDKEESNEDVPLMRAGS